MRFIALKHMFDDLYQYVPEGWRSYIDIPSLNRVIGFLNKHQPGDVLPSKDRIFEAFSYISPDDVRIVILGAPSPQRELSSGIAYSIPLEYRFTDIYKRIPEPSLQKAVTSYLRSVIGRDIDDSLKEAVRSGILLLNYPLTCTVRRKYAHMKCGWEAIVKRIVERLLYRDDSRLVLVAWNEESYNLYSEIVSDWLPNIDGNRFTSPSHKGLILLIANGPDKNISIDDKRSRYRVISSRLGFDKEAHKSVIRKGLL